MTAGQVCNRIVVIGDRRMRVDEAARLMREHHVGSVVVVDETEAGRMPVGIVTDRDVTVGIVAKKLDASTILVEEIMAGDLVTVREDDSIYDALRLMRARGVRRVVVTTAGGALAGILTLDDVLETIAEQLGDLARAVNSERSAESHRRRN